MRKFLKATLTACTLFAAPTEAATLIVESGVLKGATGVIVQGQSYNVAFVEGTCSQAFGGCDQISDFDFATASEAFWATDAILNQVAIDGAYGSFDSSPGTVFGCENVFGLASYNCNMYVPYAFTAVGSIAAVGARNWTASFNTSDGSFAHPGIPTDFDTTNSAGAVWARFTLASAVPEPATWAMMILGFGAIGGVLRSRRNQKIVPALASTFPAA